MHVAQLWEATQDSARLVFWWWIFPECVLNRDPSTLGDPRLGSHRKQTPKILYTLGSTFLQEKFMTRAAHNETGLGIIFLPFNHSYIITVNWPCYRQIGGIMYMWCSHFFHDLYHVRIAPWEYFRNGLYAFVSTFLQKNMSLRMAKCCW